MRARVYGNGNIDTPFNNILVTNIYDDTQANLLGTVTNTNTTAAWSSYTTLSAPPGGWDWTKVQALESLSIGADMGSGSIEVNLYKVEIEVTTIFLGSSSLSPSASPSAPAAEIETINKLDKHLISKINGLIRADIYEVNGLLLND